MSTRLSPKSFSLSVFDATPTAAPTVLATIAPSSSKGCKVKSVTIWNPGKATAAQNTNFTLLTQTTAASGGTVTTVTSKDQVPFDGVVRTGAVTAGTAGATLARFSVFTPSALAAFTPVTVTFDKPVVLPAGSKGAILRVDNGASGYTDLDVSVDIEA